MEIKEKKFYNLTHAQKRIWYIEKINSDSQIHNLGGCLRIQQSICVDKLDETINILEEKNDALRIRLVEKEGQPVQYIQEYEKHKIDLFDFSSCEMPEIECLKWAHDLFEQKLTLEDSPLAYYAIYKVDDNNFGIFLKIHHIVADGWSVGIMQKQVCEIYNKLMNDENIEFEEACSYVDIIEKENVYLESDKFTKNKNFWVEKFKDIQDEHLYNGSINIQGNRKTYTLDNDFSDEIWSFLKDNQCSLNTFFTAILLIYINKTIYQRDIVIGTPVFNRTGNKEKNTIGMFTSTMAVKYNLDTELSIIELVTSINREIKMCFINQRYPYDLLIGDLELNKKGYDSLFKMCVNYYNSKLFEVDGMGLELDEFYNGNQSYSMQLIIQEWDKGRITLNFDYKTDEYTEQDIAIMYNCMNNIIKQIFQNTSCNIKDIKLLSEDEINYKIHTLNSTYSDYPTDKTIYELFEEQVKNTPDNIAVVFEALQLTYRELNEKANQMANYLREQGVKRQTMVGILQTHSLELVISILAVLKAGGAYLPIDPAYPSERINYLMEDSKCLMLLTNLEIDSAVNFDKKILNVKNIEVDSYSKENLTKVNEPKDLVYVIYTSGSTGKPKGVMLEHRGLVNYACWAKKMYLKGKTEVIALYSSIAFDLTVTSIFMPLISGSKIIIYDNDENEFVLYKILRENRATVVKLTPAHLTLLKDLDNKGSNIKRFIVGGEDLKVSLAKETYDSFDGDIEILNEYGPTETVVGCMIYKYDVLEDKAISVPIGYPAENVQIYILDNEFNAVPTGITGELYISGDGVARGYLNNEKLTNERFIDNPFIKGKKMYKTGDTARYLENGVIEYIGRSDNQVKIRGHRIEIGEIEKYLLENENVKDAIVVYKKIPSGVDLLNAYIVRNGEIIESEIKKWLIRFLPKYMMPSNFIFMDILPLTVNGKIDYNMLPEIDNTENEKIFMKYENEIEKEIVEVMEEILRIENISMNDNYHQIGGDSIKAIQISSKLKNSGLELKVKDILTYDTIGEIAACAEIAQKNIAVDQNECVGEIFRTPIIEWFFKQDYKNESYYNQYILLETKLSLDINKVKIAANKLIEHHDILRVNYNRATDKLYYNNKYLVSNEVVQYIDLSDYSYDEQEKKIKELRSEINGAFDIENKILFKLYIFDLGNKGQVLLFSAHHLVVDGVSWRIIIDDFFAILKQLGNNEDISLPLKTYSFKTWTEQLQEYSKNNFDNEKEYWEGLEDKYTAYPVDFCEEQDTVKSAAILHSYIEDFDLEAFIKKANEIYNIELNEVLTIALILTINKLKNYRDVVIELERHGREAINDYTDISRTVGWFTSMYPAYFSVPDNDLDSNIKLLKEQLKNIPGKGFNYSILKYQKYELKENNNKYIRLNYLGDFDNIINSESLSLSNIEFGLDSDAENSLTALMDITAMIVNKKLKLTITYSKNRFKRETIESFMNSYKEILKQIYEFCFDKDIKEFTPSDFDAVNISQDDLDSLFE